MTRKPDPSPAPNRERLHDLLYRYGDDPASFQLLGPDFQDWFGEFGAVAYVDTGASWVVGGSVLAPVADRPDLVRDLISHARSRGRRVRLVSLDPPLDVPGLDRFCFGEIPRWNPQTWRLGSRSLREQCRRARAKGVRTRRIDPEALVDANSPLRQAMAAIVLAWLRSRPAPPMRFIARVEPFFRVRERCYLVAEQAGKLIAFLVAVPVPGRNGWMIEAIFRLPGQTPNGVSDLLIDAAMRTFAEQGATYATLGAVPLTDRVHPWLRLVRFLGSPLYPFRGLWAFKAKFRPERWDPMHIAYPEGDSAVLAFWDVAMAFIPTARGSLVRPVLKAYRWPMTATMTVLLIPWTLLLSRLDTGRWFPSPLIQSGWVAFDSSLILLFTALLIRPGPDLFTALALLTGLDALLTALQAIGYNLPRATGVSDLAGILLAIAGPALVSLFLRLTR